jgi:hypothetical protein
MGCHTDKYYGFNSKCMDSIVNVRGPSFLIRGPRPYISAVTQKVAKLKKFAEFWKKLFVAGFVWPRAIE